MNGYLLVGDLIEEMFIIIYLLVSIIFMVLIGIFFFVLVYEWIVLENRNEVFWDLLINVFNWCVFDQYFNLLLVCCEFGVFVFMYFDFDYFKLVNDWFGYVVGDCVLVEFVEIL